MRALGVELNLVSEAEVMHALLESPGDHVPLVGAGVSREAGVLLAGEISEQIRQKLLRNLPVSERDEWARRNLNWDNPKARYQTCVRRYGSVEQRVSYFRRLLVGKQPAFAHHALALLMSEGVLSSTALTTNFDKLLERAFTVQGRYECQAMRTAEEIEFWGQERNRGYVFKLHGDYDTHNILNTRSETRTIPSYFLEPSRVLLRGRGLLVLGSAGNEESIFDFVKVMLSSEDRRVLSKGLRWGVYVGEARPSEFSEQESAELIVAALDKGAVSRQIVELIADSNEQFHDRRPCSMFPIWGTGQFLHRFIKALDRPSMRQTAEVFLDHDMRLRSIFTSQGLSTAAIEHHLARLESARERVSQHVTPENSPTAAVTAISQDRSMELRLVYADISSEATLGDPQFSQLVRGVVSPEDTSISAGGGVAYQLLVKAGARLILNELAKHTPIRHGSSVVTSGGDLPVHYIFHAAALEIGSPNGEYHVTKDSITNAVSDVFNKAAALEVATLWIPLLGAGVGLVPPIESFQAIVNAVVAIPKARPPRTILLVVFDEGILNRYDVNRVFKNTLPPDYAIQMLGGVDAE